MSYFPNDDFPPSAETLAREQLRPWRQWTSEGDPQSYLGLRRSAPGFSPGV